MLSDANPANLEQVDRVVRDTSEEAKAARSWNNLRETTRIALSDLGITEEVYAIWMKPEHDMADPEVMARMERDERYRNALIGNDARIRAAIVNQYETTLGQTEPAFFPKSYEAQQRRDAAEPGGAVDRESLRPAVQKLSDLVESLPEGYRGKKQLRAVVGRLVGVLDAKASFGETNDGTSYDENALAVADELVRLENNLREIPDSDIRSSMLEIHGQLGELLTDSGYEVVEHLRRRFKPGLKYGSTEFRSDDTLAEGEEVITRVRKPQVNYGGQMVQAAEVVVSQGTRPLTAEEQQKRDAEEKRQADRLKAAEEKLKTKPETQKKRTVTATTPHGTFTTTTANPRSHVLLGRVTRDGKEEWVRVSWIGRPELVADRIAAYSSKASYAEVKAFPVDEQPKPKSKPRARKQKDAPWDYEEGLPPSAPANLENEENIGLGRLLVEVEVGYGDWVDAIVYEDREVARSEGTTGIQTPGFQAAASQAFHAINNHIDLAIEQDTTGILAPGKKKNKKTGKMEQTGYTHPTQDDVIEALTDYLIGRRFRRDQKVKHRIVAAAKLVVEAGDSGYANAGTAKSMPQMTGDTGLSAGATKLATLRGEIEEAEAPSAESAQGVRQEPDPDWVDISDEDAKVIASALSKSWVEFAWQDDPAMRDELAKAIAGTTRTIDDVRSAVEAQFLAVFNEVRQRTAAPIWAEATAIETDLTREENPLNPEDVLAVLFSQEYIARGKRTTTGEIVYGPLKAVNMDNEARASLESNEIDSNIRQFSLGPGLEGTIGQGRSVYEEAEQVQPRPSDLPATDTGDLLDRITPGSFLESVLLFMQRGRAFWAGEKVAGVNILDKGRLARARTETLRQYWIRADFEAGRKLKRPGAQLRADLEVIRKARSVFSDIAGLKGLKDAAIEDLTSKQRESLMAQLRRAVEKARRQL